MFRISNIFNFENEGIHNVFTVFGIKFKIKTSAPPPEKMELLLKKWYLKQTGSPLDLDNPKTFNEKIQWLKLYDSTPIKTKLADKYLVRDWVKEKIGKAFAQNPENQAEIDAEGEKYLIPLLGVWDKFDDIDFDKLPDRFVLKCNHGCGYNIIVKDKSKFNKKVARKKINKWMSEDFAYKMGYEMHYSAIPRKIIAESFIQDKNKELNDYKIMCFSGIPKYIWVDKGRFTDHRRNIYNTGWKLQPFLQAWENTQEDILPPENLEKMIELAKILSEGFPFVRVDFYNVDGKIYFGEMTFTSASGIEQFIPSKYNTILGDMLKLPNKDHDEIIL